ncbi:right-handed parallel beta-helix repeat-containing protein [Pseudaminobacter sp. 19-2017]|uniref:Right-handed parallel beta-helix repeat-containing protein n=1 Tax=Pseudaminobacter soli (ex Zhang et al. 2022) TaxID=2831468 RepID=A0A942DZ76_9HYPH|nr:NosD domain-containing protein [Pseudaminobacter soli]MBS3648218.1 right-handed parallel beta-helix repeat-containing protein [Pseudaminobacter soli]
MVGLKTLGSLGLVTLSLAGLSFQPALAAEQKACTPALIRKVLAPATKQDRSVRIDCDLTLKPGDVVTKSLQLVGAQASGATLACNGATLDGRDGTPNKGRDMIVVGSLPPKGDRAEWSVPAGVTVTGCRVLGSVRIKGAGVNGQDENLREWSRSKSYTERAQAAAPRDIRFEKMEIVGQGRVPFYVAVGATRVSLSGSRISGVSNGPGIYLDAESAGNAIENNRIEVETTKREQLAIDGSANNRIVGNRFSDRGKGGVFVYRNCGEGGLARHQTPSDNLIAENVFEKGGWFFAQPAIWIGSRQGRRSYCGQDSSIQLGSGIDDLDHATRNRVVNNRFVGRKPDDAIRTSEADTVISGNKQVAAQP